MYRSLSPGQAFFPKTQQIHKFRHVFSMGFCRHPQHSYLRGDRMDEKTVMAEIEKMPLEKKLVLLCETDKAFIRGYIERAVFEQRRAEQMNNEGAAYLAKAAY
jgi:hypothetical protein